MTSNNRCATLDVCGSDSPLDTSDSTLLRVVSCDSGLRAYSFRAAVLLLTSLPHVDLIKGCQHSAGVLGFLQPLGDPQSHAVHLDLRGKRVFLVKTNNNFVQTKFCFVPSGRVCVW